MLSAADFQVSGIGLRAGNTATPTGNTCQWIDTGNTWVVAPKADLYLSYNSVSNCPITG